MFSKRGLVNLKFFLIFSISIFLFTTSVIYTLTDIILERERSYAEGTSSISKGEGDSLLINLSAIVYLFGFGVVLLTFLYSKFLSKDSRGPIELINRYLTNTDEKSFREIPKEKLPEDFHLLADTINDLINRIDTFIKYQNQLFLGTSHELKTPLAVIRLKNQVLLMKPREVKEYVEVIKATNEKVDEMSKVIGDVLSIGRQESAQFESPVEMDIISYLKRYGDDFSLLADAQEKRFEINLEPETFLAPIQKTLLSQIVQNFLQNALKFTPQGKKVELRSELIGENLKISVLDEGIGVDEKIDIFAPFQRMGNKSGIGLGLFLAKSAADAMSAKISVKNRKDGVQGTIATLQINKKMVCLV